MCIEVIGGNGSSPLCTAASGAPDALLYVAGTPGFGLVPNGVPAVTVTYQTAPPRTVAVHHNFFVIVSQSHTAAPCGVQWLDTGGTVIKTPTGCSYLGAETNSLTGTGPTSRAGSRRSIPSSRRSRRAIAAGNAAGAEAAWLAAHLTWLDIGQDDGAYGCFGRLGGDIDGLAAGHPLGTSDPGFTGFHRIEFDLWTDHDLAAAAADTATLQRLLAGSLEHAPLSSYLPATPRASATGCCAPRGDRGRDQGLADRR